MNSEPQSLKYDINMITRIFVQLMPAAILSMIIPSINSVIDVFVASRYIGTSAVTAIGYFTPFTYVLAGISAILAGGSVILMGKYLGGGKHKEACELFSTDMIIVEIIIVLISVMTELFAFQMADILGANGDMIKGTGDYLRGIAFSFPATYGTVHLTSFLELEQRHKRNIIGVFTMLALNISLDVMFVAVFNMGLWGLGLATSVAAWGNFLIQVQYYMTKDAQLRFSLKDMRSGLIWEIVKIGFPGAVTQIYLAIRGYMMNSMLQDCSGEVGVAALATQATLGAFTYAASYGISVATRTLFSVFVGSKDVYSLKMVMKTALFRVIPFSFLFAIFMTSLSVPFTRIFYSDPTTEVYHLTLLLFLTNPFAMFLSGFGQIFSTYYQCHSWMKITNVISAFDGIIGMAVSMLVLTPLLGAFGVWLSYITSGLIVIIVILIFTIIKTKKFPVSIDDWMILPEGFGIPAEHRREFSVHSLPDVTKCSETIMEFCDEEGVDKKHSYFAGLAMEEIARNVVTKGFENGKRHTCAIEIAAFKDELIVRIIDDGRAFDPVQRAKLIDPDDPIKNIGVKLVRGISKDMNYSRVVGLNVLTISI